MSLLFNSDSIILSDTQLFVNNFFLLFIFRRFVSISATNFNILPNSFINVKHFLTICKIFFIGNLQFHAFPNQLSHNITLFRQSQPYIYIFIVLKLLKIFLLPSMPFSILEYLNTPSEIHETSLHKYLVSL